MRKRIHFAVVILSFIPAIGLKGAAVRDVAGQLAEADRLVSANNYEQAEQLYRAIAAGRAGTDYGLEAQEKLTCLYATWGKEPEAQAGLEKLLAGYSQHERIATAVTHVADAYRQRENHQRACEIYADVIEAWPEDEHAMWSQMGLTISYASLGNDAAAQSAFGLLRSEYTAQEHISRAVCLVGDHYRKLQNHKKACELYEDVLASWPDAEFALWSRMGLAISRIRLRDGAAAKAAIERLTADAQRTSSAQDQRIPIAMCMVADEYRAVGQYEEACELYQRVVGNYPQAEHALWSQMNLAVSNIRLGWYDAATAAADRLLADYSQDERLPLAARTLGDEYRQNERLPEAFELYEYVVANHPGTQEALWSQMNLAISKVSFDDPNADTETERLLARNSKDPGMPAAVCWVADQYRRSGRADKAKELYDRVMAEYPDTEYAMWSRMGLVILDIHPAQNGAARDVNDAVDRLIADFNDQPELANATFRIGEEYYYKAFVDPNICQEVKSEEDLNRAKGIWEKIIGQCPQSESIGFQHANYFSAACYLRLGQYDKALGYYQEVVDNWPGYQYAWSAQCLIGECYEKLRNSGKLEEYEAKPKIMQAYKAVIDKYPDSSLVGHACLKLGNMNFEASQWDEAAMYFGLFLEKYPGDVQEATALYHLGKTYENMGEFDTAIEVYRMFLERAEPGDYRIGYVAAKVKELGG